MLNEEIDPSALEIKPFQPEQAQEVVVLLLSLVDAVLRLRTSGISPSDLLHAPIPAFGNDLKPQ